MPLLGSLPQHKKKLGCIFFSAGSPRLSHHFSTNVWDRPGFRISPNPHLWFCIFQRQSHVWSPSPWRYRSLQWLETKVIEIKFGHADSNVFCWLEDEWIPLPAQQQIIILGRKLALNLFLSQLIFFGGGRRFLLNLQRSLQSLFLPLSICSTNSCHMRSHLFRLPCCWNVAITIGFP